MNSFRHDPDLEPFRDGTQKGDVLYFRCQWYNAGQLHIRDDDRHYSAVFAHPENPNMFLTPYAHEYFRGVLPTQMPENPKVKNIVVATDLDAKFWEHEFYGPPAHAFDDVTEGIYDRQNHDATLWRQVRFDGELNKVFEQNMRHMPRTFFLNEEFSTALVVLSAHQSVCFHLREMAGIGCLPDTDFDKGDVHDALMRHEWFHLTDDRHLSKTQSEIEADKAAIQGIETLSLKRAWVDARIVGGFMWPFPERQNGLALIDSRFDRMANQELQMMVVYEWCDRIFREFYAPKISAEMISDIYEPIAKEEYETVKKQSFLPEELKTFFKNKFWSKGRNDREKLLTPDKFEGWLKEGEDQVLSKQAWRYLTQAYMMRLQASNMHRPEFYSVMRELSEKISPREAGQDTKRAQIHSAFRESLVRLLPEAAEKVDEFQPEWIPVQLPNVGHRGGPYVGERSMSWTLTTFNI